VALVVLLAGAVASLTAFGMGGAPESARAAGTSCENAVVTDWSRDGRVDGTYPLACYRRALARLPSDMRDYSDAPDEIERALAVASNRRAATPAPQSRTTAPDTAPPLVLVAIGLAVAAAAVSGGAALLTRRRRRRPAS
jgi:hypothetical protein